MPQRGWWGDKVIITLSSDDLPRHKNWCEHYRKSDNHCCKQNLKCFGSAHCSYYIKKGSSGFTEIDVGNPQIPTEVTKEIILPEEEKSIKAVSSSVLGRHPSFGEKMVGKIVFVKGFKGHLHIGEVVQEDHDTFTIERDDGEVRKYVRKAVLRAKSVWVIDNYEEYICHFK